MADAKEKVVAIVFNGGVPWSVATDIRTYNVVKSKDGTLYYHASGGSGVRGNTVFLEGGRSSDYWLAKRFQPEFSPGIGDGNRLKHVNPKWLRLPEAWGIEAETVYCSVCDDWFSTKYAEGACRRSCL